MKKVLAQTVSVIGGVLAVATWTSAAMAAASEFSTQVEALKLGGAKAGFMETGSAAADRSLLVRSSTASLQVLGKTKTRLTNSFKYLAGDTTPLLTGKCVIRMEGRSMFNIDFSQNKAQVYGCEFQGKPDNQFAMEVALPAFAEAHLGGGPLSITISRNTPDAVDQSILRARLIYEGQAYEALPTGFGLDRPMTRRVVQGYNVMRNGKLVGRLSYRQSGVTSVKDQADIVVPMSEADGRTAVLFMIMSLNAMPDVYASQVREELAAR